ncbi:MAG: 3-oxo-tetronate 4-phosphate decarboxylase [Pseudomonadota bacterium]
MTRPTANETRREEIRARDEICRLGNSMFARGLTFGASGNISVRLDDGWLMTPTGVTLGTLEPDTLSKIDLDGRHVGGDAPTKEAFLHRVMYDKRGTAGAVVHLHATHSVAVSCLADIDPTNVLPPITAYHVMRVGRLPLVPYFPPGDIDLARAVGEFASDHHAVLLANHGPVVAGRSLAAAVAASEELEETAKLFLMLQGHRTRFLDHAQVQELEDRFRS